MFFVLFLYSHYGHIIYIESCGNVCARCPGAEHERYRLPLILRERRGSIKRHLLPCLPCISIAGTLELPYDLALAIQQLYGEAVHAGPRSTIRSSIPPVADRNFRCTSWNGEILLDY